MKMIPIILLAILFSMPLVSAQESNPSQDFFGWIYNSISNLWEYFDGSGNIIDTSGDNITSKNQITKEITNLNQKQILINPIYSLKTGEFIVQSQEGIDSFYSVSFKHIENSTDIQIDYCLTDDKLKEAQTYSETNCKTESLSSDECSEKDKVTTQPYIDYKVPSTIKESKTINLLSSKIDNQIDVKPVLDSKTLTTSNCISIIENPYLVDEIELGEHSTYIISQYNVFVDAILNNVTVESNYSHLTIDTTQTPYDSLVLYYPFDVNNNSNGKTYDYSSLGNDGSIVGGNNITWSSNSIYGGMYNFSGGVNYIQISDSNSLNISGTITMSFWVNPNNVASGRRKNIIDKWFDRYSMYIDSTNMYINYKNESNVANEIKFTGAIPTANTWYYCVGIINSSGNVSLYVNGVLKNTTAFIGTSIRTTTNPLYIGSSAGTNYYMNGSIDDVMIFNTSLTSAQILAIYNNQSSRFKTQGTFNLNNQTYLNITSGDNRVSVQTNYNTLFNTNISLFLGVYNGSWYSVSAQNLTGNNTFNISTGATNLTLNFTLLAFNNTNPFYTPNLINGINFTTWTEAGADTTPPTITFLNQTPVNITSFNIYTSKLNVTYNITDASGVNVSSVYYYSKTNTTTSEIWQYINGTQTVQGYFPIYPLHRVGINISNSSSVWQFLIDAVLVYPSTFNLDPEVTGLQNKSMVDLYGIDYYKIRFYNMTNNSYGTFNFMCNSTTNANDLRIYHCNSTYVTGLPQSTTSCGLFANFPKTQIFNYTLTPYSAYNFVPFNMNTSTNKIAGVKVTQTGYFILRAPATGHWYCYYVTNISQPDSIQESTNPGTSWTNFSGTINAFVSQYTPNNYTNYAFVSACDNLNNCINSSVRSNPITEQIQRPTIPSVYSPTAQVYSGNITINYTSSDSTSGMSYYNISLMFNNTYNKTIIANNSLNLSYMWSSIATIDGNYTIRVQAMDLNGSYSYGYSDEFEIDNTPPYFINISNISIYTNQSLSTQFNASDNIAFGSFAINWTNTFSITSNGLLTNSSGLSAGIYYINVTINDSANNLNSTVVWVNVTQSVIPDTSYPIFSNNLTYPNNNTEYAPNKQFQFNVTILNSNGSAGISFNSINYSMSNLSSVFNKTFNTLSAGTFPYYFWAYGNGTNNLFNNSITYYYTIAQNSSYNMTVIGTTPITYGTVAGISNTTCPSQLVCNLYRNDTGAITSPDNSILGVGYYRYTYNSTGNINYTSQSNSNFVLEVDKANSQTSLTFDKTSPQSYPNSITPTCTLITGVGSVSLTNGTSGVSEVLGVNTWNFNCSYAGNTNYSASSNSSNFQITQNTTYVLSLAITPSTNEIYPVETTATGSGCPIELTCNLSNNVSGFLVNPHIETLGVGIYNYTYNSSGNTNYSIKSVSSLLTINQNTSAVVYTYINNSRANITIYNNTAIYLNATLFNVSGTIYLYKNGTLINSGSSSLSNLTSFNGTGIYNITAIYLGNINYSSAYETWWVNVTASACVQNLQNTSWSGWSNLTCSGTQMNQSRFLTQYDTNNCGYTNQTIYEYQLVNPVYQNTTKSDWINLSCSGSNRNQSRNWTQFDVFGCDSNQTFYDYQLISDPTCTVFQWTSLTNKTCYLGSSCSHSITASGNGVNYTINNTSVFSINSTTGSITNNTALNSIITYFFNATATNSSNSKIYGLFYIDIQNTPAVTTTSSISKCKLNRFVYYNPLVPVINGGCT